MVNDISTRQDIEKMVESFYSKVRDNELLGPIFDRVIGNNWSVHLNKMYDFWETILLNKKTYWGRPFPPHLKLEVTKIHFDTWQQLFQENIDELFEGDRAAEAKKRAVLMAALFHSKYEHLKGDQRA
jgi:hemoglobin